MMRLEMFVTRSDGSTYCEVERRDTPEERRRIDRDAWHALARPNVVAVAVTSNARTGGYKR